jgi:hypothetical protein
MFQHFQNVKPSEKLSVKHLRKFWYLRKLKVLEFTKFIGSIAAHYRTRLLLFHTVFTSSFSFRNLDINPDFELFKRLQIVNIFENILIT